MQCNTLEMTTLPLSYTIVPNLVFALNNNYLMLKSPYQLTIACWNCLADCYSIGQQSKALDILDWSYRKDLIQSIITSKPIDILCLQEVDHYNDFFQPYLDSINMNSLYIQRPNKDDGCLIAYNKNKFICKDVDYINFDDLSIGLSSSSFGSVTNVNDRFLRHNVAIMAKLAFIDNIDMEFVATCGHIYWNPNKPEVKLAQTVFWLDRIKRFSTNISNLLPIIMCGDFNSLPDSEPYKYLTDISINHSNPDNCYEYINESTRWLYGSQKFLCDSTLSRLCRWMRVLGIDTAIDRSNSQNKASTKDYKDFFNRAKLENRIILTTSRQMRERTSCPRSTFVSTINLEDALVNICKEYNIKLDKEKLLTVCGKCGGEIESCDQNDDRINGRHVPSDRPVFICVDCNQPYWWNDKADSSPARAMRVADRLYEYITSRLNNTITQESNSMIESIENIIDQNDYDHIVDDSDIIDLESSTELDNNKLNENFSIRNQTLINKKHNQIIDNNSNNNINTNLTTNTTNQLIDDSTLASTSWRLRSVYYDKHNSEPDCTNWSGDFIGTLDYIFISNDWIVNEAKLIPQIDNDAIDLTESLRNQSIISAIDELVVNDSQPSEIWPSDHFLLYGHLILNRTTN